MYQLNVILLTAETLDLPLELVHPIKNKFIPKLTVISLRYFKCGSEVSNLIHSPPQNGHITTLGP